MHKILCSFNMDCALQRNDIQIKFKQTIGKLKTVKLIATEENLQISLVNDPFLEITAY